MTPLRVILRMIWHDQRLPMLLGALLGFAVLAMGVALLGLSGWFISAAAIAGLAGSAATFNVFVPSALIRFLAFGRTAARYGERVMTHDATLRALEDLRVRLLRATLAAPLARMLALRGSETLNRMSADIDALDGVPLRLALPLAAGLSVMLAVLALLAWIVTPAVAVVVVGGWMLAAAVIALGLRRTARASRLAEAAQQAFRTRMIDLIQARMDLAVYGELQAQVTHVMMAESRRQACRQTLDRADRWAGAGLVATGSIVAGLALFLGASGASRGDLPVPLVLVGVLAAVALGDAVAPLRRLISDHGRMASAARRVVGELRDEDPTVAPTSVAGVGISVRGLTLHRGDRAVLPVRGLAFDAGPGETVAICGPSGSGKSSLLFACAGLLAVPRGQVAVCGRDITDWQETSLRVTLALVPQRSAVLSGSVAEVLRLADPAAADDGLWRALDAVALDRVIRNRGGLSMRVGPRGEGLSGGELRRLVLARALLRRPAVLLLDEPTEGLEDRTARRVLEGIRVMLPEAAILMASHREAETAAAARIIQLR